MKQAAFAATGADAHGPRRTGCEGRCGPGRRAVCALLIGSLAGPVCRAQAPLPQRNLLVEVRQTGEASATAEPAPRGAVVIGSDGRVRGWAEGSTSTRTRDHATERVQQLQVLNGGRGSVRLAEAVPMEFMQASVSAQGVEVAPATVWTESGNGFSVQPSWPGGTAPVTVEIAADRSDASRRAEVLSTVRIPLGEWVTIARSVEDRRATPPGTVSSRDAAGRRAVQQLQIRITAP